MFYILSTKYCLIASCTTSLQHLFHLSVPSFHRIRIRSVTRPGSLHLLFGFVRLSGYSIHILIRFFPWIDSCFDEESKIIRSFFYFSMECSSFLCENPNLFPDGSTQSLSSAYVVFPHFSQFYNILISHQSQFNLFLYASQTADRHTMRYDFNEKTRQKSISASLFHRVICTDPLFYGINCRHLIHVG